MVVLTSDVNTLQRLISSNTLGLFGSLLSFVVVLVLMIVQDWQLTGLILLTFPVLFILNNIFVRNIRAAYRRGGLPERQPFNKPMHVPRLST